MPADDAVPAFARGVRFRRLPDGRAVLLVPEGVVNLNATAAAVAGLLDGRRTSAAISRELSAGYAAAHSTIAADVADLLHRLEAKGWVFFSSPGEGR